VNVYIKMHEKMVSTKKSLLIAVAIGCGLIAVLFLFVGGESWRGWVVIPAAVIGGLAAVMAYPSKLPPVMGADPVGAFGSDSQDRAMAMSQPAREYPYRERPSDPTPTPPWGIPVESYSSDQLMNKFLELAQRGLEMDTTDEKKPSSAPPYRERAHVMGLIANWAKWAFFLVGSLVGAGTIASHPKQSIGFALGLIILLILAIVYSKGEKGKKIRSFIWKTLIFFGVIAAMSASGTIFLVALGLILIVVISRMVWIWIKWYYTEIIADDAGFGVDFNTPAYLPFSDRNVRARRRSIPITEYDQPWWAELFHINFVHLGQDTAAQKLDDVLHQLRYLRYPELLIPFIEK